MSATPHWSLDPLLYATLPKEVFETYVINHSLMQFSYLVLLIFSTIYSITHKILQKYSVQYNALENRSKQIVVVHHAVEGLILSCVFPFFSYYMIRSNFQIHEELDEVLKLLRSVAKCMLIIIFMYFFELASRFDEPRPIVVFHHLLASLDGFLAILFPTSIMYKTSSILVYFICFEALTFVGLFMYRIFPESAMTSKVIFAGMVSFGITRPLQVLWVGAAVFGSWNDVQTVRWQAIMQLILSCMLTVIQVMTLKIHYGMWRRCISKKERMVDVLRATDDNKDEENSEC
jgi:hypothetical protein